MQDISGKVGDQAVAMSAVGYTELLNGLYIDRDSDRFRRRQQFFNELLSVVPIMSYTHGVASIAGRIGGEQAALGLTVPFVDLLIGATALFHEYFLMTTNVRHFRMIPNLHVISF
jgi:tRNA(fMet)-specific endonuclease VapC